jgi:hypothetical protein
MPRPEKQHMADPGSWPNTTVYPSQDKPSTSLLPCALLVLLIKTFFEEKSMVTSFYIDLSLHLQVALPTAQGFLSASTSGLPECT